MQCSQANLKNIESDCITQISVPCSDQQIPGIEKPFCFSRQSVTQKGSNSNNCCLNF